MKTSAHLHHRVPGRMRLRIPQRRGDLEYFTTLARELAQVAGVTRVECNPRTASVLVLHASDAADAILAQARARNLFEVADARAESATLAQHAGAGLRTLDGKLRSVTRGDIDMNSLILGGFVTMGVVQLYRGHIVGPAVTLFWYAYQIMSKSNPVSKSS